MSDIDTSTESVDTGADTGTEVDLFDTDTDTFPREYVERLRTEAADYRTKYAPFRDTFKDHDEDVRDYVLDLNQKLLSPDKSAWVAEVKSLLKEIEGTPEGDALEEATGITLETDDDLDKPLTRRQLQELETKRANEAAQAEITRNIHETLTGHGYKQGKEDPWGDTAAVISMASMHYNGDINAAHAARSARFAEAVEAAVAERIESIRSGSEQFPAVTSGGAGSPNTQEEHTGPKDFSWARKRVNARLDSAAGV